MCCVEYLWNYSPTNVTTSNESCWETIPFPLITRIIHVACFLDQNNFVLTTSHTHLAVVKIGSPFTQPGTDSCLTGNLMVSSFDLKNMAKKQLEDRNFYNEVRERERLVSMLFGPHGKRTETTTSNILKVSLLSYQVRSNLTTPN